MKQFDVFYLFSAAKKGFKLGTIICFGIFVFIRLIFWNYEFTFLEEVSNVLQIGIIGGLMFAGAVIIFLLAEMAIVNLDSQKVYLAIMPKMKRVFLPLLLLFQDALKYF